ncbi:Uncharacterised protein [Candidatus Gugararchaeum adminiculabundum]|nr:Uncharacterised protein [Candidatus Gugararchaeum adminiculabundum]
MNVRGNSAKVKSAIGDYEYSVKWNGEKEIGKGRIDSNDDEALFKGFLGFPAIAFLMKKELVSVNPAILEASRGIDWEKIFEENEKGKKDASHETESKIKSELIRRGVKQEEIEEYLKKTLKEIKKLEMKPLGELV